MISVYDYLDAAGVNIIKVWTEEFGPKEWAKIRNKLELIQRVSDPVRDLPQILDGPDIQGEPEIWKLHIGGSGTGRALRPMVCRGPFNKNIEVTLLVGAEEKGGKLPKGIAKKAETHRQHILADPKRRRAHEWVDPRPNHGV